MVVCVHTTGAGACFMTAALVLVAPHRRKVL